MKVRTGAGILGLTLLLVAGIAWASIVGTISGTVTDQTGAIVPGAAVLIRDTETGIQHSMRTDSAGFYSFPALPVGHYDVVITANGFKQYRETGLVLNVNENIRVDARLQVGEIQQQVSVSSSIVHVATASTQMGETIASAKMARLPLNGRSYTDLLALQPGVAPASSGENGANSVSGDLNPGAISISGQRESANGFVLNGGSAEEKLYNAAAIVPDLDSIAEFRIITNNGSAEYGNYSGGVVNVVTKSGTNQFHGDAFEFLRNPDFDARNFYSPERGVLHQNQFGGTFGGPIKHDTAFFFGDFQGTRLVQGVDTGLIPVPSVAEKQGDLTGVANQLAGTVNGNFWAGTLAQELGYPVTAGEPYYSGGCTTSSQCVFPNAIIPQRVMPAPTAFLMKYIPDPNQGPYFTTSAFKENLTDNKGSIRLDANTRLGKLMGYYFIDNFDHMNPYGGANVPGFPSADTGRAQMVNFGLTRSLGASAFNDLRLTYMRDVLFTGFPQGGLGVSPSTQGFTGIYPLYPAAEQGVEPISFNNFSIGAANGPLEVYDNTYEITDNFSKVVGSHLLQFGGGGNYFQVAYKFALNLDGQFSFDGQETGSDFADFLIGAPSGYSQGIQLPMYGRSRYFGFYAQDSWRARRNLTLNYGLRWDVSSPWWEAHNQIEVLQLGCQSKIFPGAPTGWCFPGDNGIPSTVAPTRYDDFAPRVGIAYSPTIGGGLWSKLLGPPGQMSIRAAWGMYYSSYGDRINGQESGDAPFGYWWANPAPPMFTTPFIDRPSGLNRGQKFPAPVPPDNVGPNNPDSSIDWSQFLPLSSSPSFLSSNRVPYAEEYNFSLQRQFGQGTLLSVSYVGTQAHRLMATVEANTGNPALCLSVSQVSEVTNGVTCGPFGENGVYYPVTGGVITTTRSPYSDAFGSNGYMATMANSNYNALEVSVRHRLGGLELLAGYTWSKSLDNASGDGLGQGDNINPIDPRITKGLSAFDSTNNFVVSYHYELPFQKLWHANRLTSGWSIGGITRFATGFPVYLVENDDNSLLGTFGTGQGNTIDVPNRLEGALDITNPRLGDPATGTHPYFNTSLFTKEAIGQLGNSSRRFFHGPGFNDWDLILAKDLSLTESKTLQFRAEFFNAFNHAQFENPSGDILNSAFGYVTNAQAARVGQLAVKFLF